MSLFRKKGFVDNLTNKRIGLLFLRKLSDRVYIDRSSYNTIVEVVEVYRDKTLSKIEAINVPFNSTDYSNSRILKDRYLPVWTESENIYWLSPPIDVDRDNKLKEILK